MNVQTKKQGFTIIEVVLVLAIAGLIFLMVFIALPALQRNQRDTARKNDVSTVASSVTSYVSNNRATFPTTATIASYVTNLSDNSAKVVVAPIGTLSIAAGSGSATTSTTAAAIQDALIVVTQRTKCGTPTATGGYTLTTGTSRQFTVVTKLESGNGAPFCQES